MILEVEDIVCVFIMEERMSTGDTYVYVIFVEIIAAVNLCHNNPLN
jgi:hypothetical protein